MLDRRKATILRAVVRDYVRTGQPLGSKTLVERYRLKVSSATIRNDLALLEELGYVAQPYTSAGRIPTDLGYRWYIDNWPAPSWPPLSKRDLRAIQALVRSDYRGIDEALEETSQVLSDVTESTSVVVSPPPKRNRLRRLELLRRDDGRATLLLIADTGAVEQGTLEVGLEGESDHERLAQALSAEFGGTAFEDIPEKLRTRRPTDPVREALAAEIERMVGSRLPERVFRGGTANILSADKFADISMAHEVIEALEQPSALAPIVSQARHSGGLLVYVGKEVPVEQMKACSVIFATFDAGQELRGALGIVGPTRMDYPHMISAVEVIARSLSKVLESVGV